MKTTSYTVLEQLNGREVDALLEVLREVAASAPSLVPDCDKIIYLLTTQSNIGLTITVPHVICKVAYNRCKFGGSKYRVAVLNALTSGNLNYASH